MEDFPGWRSTKEETSAETGQHSSSTNIKKNLPLSWRSKWGNEKSKPQREPEISACRNQPCVLGGLGPNLGRKTWNHTVLAGPLRNQKLHATASRAETLGVSGRCHFSKLRDAAENHIVLFLLCQQFEENVQRAGPRSLNILFNEVIRCKNMCPQPKNLYVAHIHPLKLRRWLIRPALKRKIISEILSVDGGEIASKIVAEIVLSPTAAGCCGETLLFRFRVKEDFVFCIFYGLTEHPAMPCFLGQSVAHAASAS